MRVEFIAKVAHYTLTDNVIEVGLSNADDAGDNRHDEHDANEDHQQGQVALADSIIEDELYHKGVHEAQNSSEDDREENQHHLRFVGTERLHDAPHCESVLRPLLRCSSRISSMPPPITRPR